METKNNLTINSKDKTMNFIEFEVTQEQKVEAIRLVKEGKNHPVSNRWSNNKEKEAKTKIFRYSYNFQ